jgi:hypothetical protein
VLSANLAFDFHDVKTFLTFFVKLYNVNMGTIKGGRTREKFAIRRGRQRATTLSVKPDCRAVSKV